jgi:hypothetical protein
MAVTKISEWPEPWVPRGPPYVFLSDPIRLKFDTEVAEERVARAARHRNRLGLYPNRGWAAVRTLGGGGTAHIQPAARRAVNHRADAPRDAHEIDLRTPVLHEP